MKSKICGIYCIENLLNHKKYIGLTKNSIAERMAKHIQAAKSEEGFLLHRAIRKYGKENFTFYRSCSVSLRNGNGTEPESVRYGC